MLLGADFILWDVACFHAQQAAEKHLKALLVRQMIRPPRTHDLSRLCTAVRSTGYALPDVDDECRLLDPFAVDVRYPERVPIPDEVTGRATVAAARRVIAACRPEQR